MIPKIIHQIWVGPHPRPKAWMDTWRAMHPDWLYVLWDNDALMLKGYWQNEALLHNSTNWHGIADVMRYEILYRFGGIYIDSDSECVRPLDEALLENEAFCCYDNERARPGLLANGFLGAVPHHKLMKHLAVDLFKYITQFTEPVWENFGPGALTRHWPYSDASAKVYPSFYFLPVHHEGQVYTGDFKPYCKHHWGTTKGLYGRAQD